MHLQKLAIGSLLTSSSVAVNLFASSYAGTITSLQFTEGTGSLKSVAVNKNAGPYVSWLEKINGNLYAVDEAWSTTNGSISAFKIQSSGVLTRFDKQTSLGGPVSEVAYNSGKAIAVAHYSGSGLQTWKISSSGTLSLIQTFKWTLSRPGAVPSRQEAPHPHEVILDPTGTFIVVPDLGADLLRVFSIDATTSVLTESTSYSMPAGSGPRHGDFVKTSSGTFFFIHTELSNQVYSFKVTYGTKKLSFQQVSVSGTFGSKATPAGAAAAEAFVSPDGKYLLTSSRNATLFTLPPFTAGGANIPSDSLQSFQIDQATGKLTWKQTAAAGGKFPRQFSVNKDGTLAAVALQNDGRVVVVRRNVSDGTFGDFVASIEGLGGVNCVIFDE